MFSVYVLRSKKNGKRYIGSTSKSPKIRLKEHNGGSNKFTRRNRPFILLYSENFSTRKEARIIETYLRGGQGRKFLDNLLK